MYHCRDRPHRLARPAGGFLPTGHRAGHPARLLFQLCIEWCGGKQLALDVCLPGRPFPALLPTLTTGARNTPLAHQARTDWPGHQHLNKNIGRECRPKEIAAIENSFYQQKQNLLPAIIGQSIPAGIVDRRDDRRVSTGDRHQLHPLLCARDL